MKFEKMNDHQIRCTLTKEDLAERKLKISELAYGTDKARSLFREMMEKASIELDFEVEDIPLMIEAVPMDSECIVLTVTKVEDPEELDTRFAQFSPSLIEDDANGEFEGDSSNSERDNLLGLFKQIAETVSASTSSEGSSSEQAPGSDEASDTETSKEEPAELTRLFSFANMNDLFGAAKAVVPDYTGTNSLYKDARSNRYLLLIGQSGMTLAAFNRVCNIASEYGNSEKNLLAANAHLEEHYEVIIENNALQKLAKV